MPAGCELVCQNELCEHYKKGFDITSPWPMGNLKDIINSTALKNNIDFQNHLIELQEEGREYACITFPDNDNIPVVAYRVNMWSNIANCIWQYDLEYNGEDVEELIEKSNIPKKCPKTDCELWDFETVIKNDILCPHCKKAMKKTRWFTK